MSQFFRRVATDRDVPRWAVILGVVGSILTAIAGYFGGKAQSEEEISRLRAERSHLVEQLVEAPFDYAGAPYEVGEHLDDQEHADARFPADRVTWYVDPRGVEQIRPAVTVDQVRAAMREAWGAWAERLQIDPVEVDREADALVVHRFGFIDGQGRTLAWSTLTDGTHRQQHQRYDTGETWSLGGPAPGQVSLLAVGVHEIGHAMGLHHDASNANAIMKPYYDPSILKPTDRDVSRMVGLGYRVRPAVPPPPTPGGSVEIRATVEVEQLADALKRAGWEVVPPAK